jgi:hypothetical protein
MEKKIIRHFFFLIGGSIWRVAREGGSLALGPGPRAERPSSACVARAIRHCSSHRRRTQTAAELGRPLPPWASSAPTTERFLLHRNSTLQSPPHSKP